MLCAHACLLRTLDMCTCAQSGAGGDDDNCHDDNNDIASIIHQLCTCAQSASSFEFGNAGLEVLNCGKSNVFLLSHFLPYMWALDRLVQMYLK